MKKYLIFHIVLFSTLFSFSQIRPDFNDTIHIGNAESFFHVFYDDTSYTAIGFDSTIFFSKFDLNGQLITVNYTNLNNHLSSSHGLSNILQINGNYIIFYPNRDSNDVPIGFIAAYDENYNQLWAKKYPYNSSIQTYSINYFTDIQGTPDEGYIVAGRCLDSSSSSNSISYLMKLDSYGNRQWYKEYPMVKEIGKIKLTPDLGILIYAYEYQKQCIIKTTSLGNIVWKKYLNQRYIWGDISRLAYYGGDYYVLLRAAYFGDINDPYNFRKGPNLIKFNYLTGEVQFDKAHEPFAYFPISGGYSLNVLSDGKIVVSSTAYTREPPICFGSNYCEKGAVIVYNTNGDSLWTKTFDIGIKDARDDMINELKITPDGGFISCGTHITWTISKNSCYSSPWIFKYTPSWATSLQNSLKKIKTIHCFPNPADDFITFRFDKMITELQTLIILSQDGREINKHKIPIGIVDYTINIKQLSSGLYMYSIVGKNGYSSGSFVKD